jgi:hypothetical protein
VVGQLSTQDVFVAERHLGEQGRLLVERGHSVLGLQHRGVSVAFSMRR